MSESTAVAVVERETGIETVGALRERMEFEASRIEEMKKFVAKHMTKDTDYGVIPGTKKPTLLKPGAEIMAGIYRLDPDYQILEAYEPERVKNWSRPVKRWDDRDKRMKAVYKDGSPVMEQGQTVGRYEVRATCTLRHISSGNTVGQGIGSCNSWEAKYLTVDLDDAKNTVLKMATKRAYVAAVLSACRLSAFFTQDMEDTLQEAEPQPRPVAVPPAKQETPSSKLGLGEPGADDGPPIYTGPVIQVTEKSGETKGRKWTAYTVEGSEGFRARTFDTKIADFATEIMVHKQTAKIMYEAGEKGNKILEIASAGNPAD